MTQPSTPPSPSRLAGAVTGAVAGAIVGIAATAAALATGELLAGLLPGVPSPILSVGSVVVDLQPPGAKEFVVSLFGTNDKIFLELLVIGVALAFGAAVGLIARTRPTAALAILGGFVVLGIAAGLGSTDTQPALAALGGLAELLVGAFILDRLGRLGATSTDGAVGSARTGTPDWSRRTLLLRGGAIAVASVAAGAAGRLLLARQRVPATGSLPGPELVAELPPGADLAIPGLTPIVVPNGDFYRIDTALLIPNVDRDAWRLRIHGMVEREVTLSFADLMQLPVIEQFVTIACVSNRVGGDLVGNAKWTGVRLRDVLDLAGVQPGATQLVGRSVDGWTAGSPTAWVMDPDREPMIAFGMNDEPLPREHGYPARVIIPGLYGYVSATKWVTELELTTLEAFDAYWIPLGWSKEAPILTQSRIDRPVRGTKVPVGPYTFAGVAWAPDRGISRVEVQVDDGDFAPATLSAPISEATWVQWKIDLDVAPGDHTLRVRATDGAGETQTQSVTRPDPDGARGWHTIPFSVG